MAILEKNVPTPRHPKSPVKFKFNLILKSGVFPLLASTI